jgi:hypothetical protein
VFGIADWVKVFQKGRSAETGSADTFFAAPRNELHAPPARRHPCGHRRGSQILRPIS